MDDADTRDEQCPFCSSAMSKLDLDGNYREYTCEDCGVEVLRPVASDHGDGVSVEDLNNAASFGNRN